MSPGFNIEFLQKSSEQVGQTCQFISAEGVCATRRIVDYQLIVELMKSKRREAAIALLVQMNSSENDSDERSHDSSHHSSPQVLFGHEGHRKFHERAHDEPDPGKFPKLWK
jgi:hypothetical protein